MALGLRLQQVLEGTYHRLSDPGNERPFSVDLEIFVGLRQWMRERAGRLTGSVNAPGLCEESAINGHFSIRLDGRIAYDFRFEDAGHIVRRFHGESEWDLLRPKRSLERVFGRVFEDDEEMARVLLHTPLEQSLVQLLASIRPRFRPS